MTDKIGRQTLQVARTDACYSTVHIGVRCCLQRRDRSPKDTSIAASEISKVSYLAVYHSILQVNLPLFMRHNTINVQIEMYP